MLLKMMCEELRFLFVPSESKEARTLDLYSRQTYRLNSLLQQQKVALRKQWNRTAITAAAQCRRSVGNACANFVRHAALFGVHALADVLVHITVAVETAQSAFDQGGRLPFVVHMHVGHTVRHDRVLALIGQKDHHLVGAAGAQKNAFGWKWGGGTAHKTHTQQMS